VLFDRPYPREFLEELTRLLNERLRGKPFTDVRDTLLDHIEAIHQRQMDLLDVARRITQQAFDLSTAGDLYLEGTGNILSLPDFSGQEDLRSLVHLLDEKRTLGEMIVRDMADDAPKFSGVRVKIGSENKSPDLKNLSLVSSTYTVGGRQMGVLGIIGPKRMEYSRMISLVNHVAQIVSQTLSRRLEDQ
ncbi:MAG TPA: HrcA family transcriptional regulator, partial [Elusimicrobiota bacterium]|nr:HrcA family transcriptional regulator [Elusimicrobiota bacterium]